MHLGFNIYYWGDKSQLSLMANHLAPLARSLLQEGTISRFWFTRFDARGPHLFLLFTTDSSRKNSLRHHLQREIRRILNIAPSMESLDHETLVRRHQECRGKELCSADRLPEIAANNSFEFFHHDKTGYPFGLSRASAEDLWRHVGAVALWSIDCWIGGKANSAAVAWIAAIDSAIRGRDILAGSYWRHHATTLISSLATRLAENESQVIASIPGIVGKRNQTTFALCWQEYEQQGSSTPDAAALVSTVLETHGDQHWWSLLREINHTTLLQLGLPVRLHLPLIFYAWQRNLQHTSRK